MVENKNTSGVSHADILKEVVRVSVLNFSYFLSVILRYNICVSVSTLTNSPHSSATERSSLSIVLHDNMYCKRRNQISSQAGVCMTLCVCVSVFVPRYYRERELVMNEFSCDSAGVYDNVSD